MRGIAKKVGPIVVHRQCRVEISFWDAWYQVATLIGMSMMNDHVFLYGCTDMTQPHLRTLFWNFQLTADRFDRPYVPTGVPTPVQDKHTQEDHTLKRMSPVYRLRIVNESSSPITFVSSGIVVEILFNHNCRSNGNKVTIEYCCMNKVQSAIILLQSLY